MTAVVITLVALIGLQQWFHYLDRNHFREEHAELQKSWRDERAELLNRIKPETAQPLPHLNLSEPEPAVELEGPQADQDYWTSRGVTVADD